LLLDSFRYFNDTAYSSVPAHPCRRIGTHETLSYAYELILWPAQRPQISRPAVLSNSLHIPHNQD
jgi:hypothetical protein